MDKIACSQTKAFCEKGFESKQGCSSVPLLGVSLRCNLNFSSMRNSHMVVVKKNFHNFKTGTNYLKLHNSCRAALSKNFVGSNFPKELQVLHLIQNPPRLHKQNCLNERRGHGEARTNAISV